MAIPLTNTITIPATAQQVADSVWIRLMTINAPSTTGKVTLAMQVVPMVSATGTLLPDKQKNVVIPDLFALAQTNTEIASALQAIYTAVSNYVNTNNTFGS